jgi:hypothetical protein
MLLIQSRNFPTPLRTLRVLYFFDIVKEIVSEYNFVLLTSCSCQNKREATISRTIGERLDEIGCNENCYWFLWKTTQRYAPFQCRTYSTNMKYFLYIFRYVYIPPS